MAATMPRLKMLARRDYSSLPDRDPLHLYYWPIFGKLYRKRVEMCLAECRSGQRVLEVGFGSGITFVNLSEQYEEIHGIDLTAKCEPTMELFRQRGIKTFLRNGNVMQLPYPENYFDTVLLISILEHLKPADQEVAFREIRRVLKPGGQVVYGVPIERPFMVFMFRLLGYNIREHHFSTQEDVAAAARAQLREMSRKRMRSRLWPGSIYEVGHYVKS